MLYEKGKALGAGQLVLAAAAPHKGILQSISVYYSEAFKQLPNVKVRLGKEAAVETILKGNPDTVIIATGGKSFIPDIPGVDRSNVVTAFDVLANRAEIEGKTVVVCGGNAVGCETASYLAKRNNRVTIVEMMESIGADIEMTSLSALREDLQRDNVTIVTGKKVDTFTESGVAVTDHQGNRTVLPADVAVLALGVAPVNDLAAELEGRVEEVYSIGDARKPARIHDAVADAFVLAYDL